MKKHVEKYAASFIKFSDRINFFVEHYPLLIKALTLNMIQGLTDQTEAEGMAMGHMEKYKKWEGEAYFKLNLPTRTRKEAHGLKVYTQPYHILSRSCPLIVVKKIIQKN